MPQLNLDNFQLQLGQVRMTTKDSGQTVQSIEILLGDQTKAEMMVNEDLNVLNLIVRDTVLADIPQLQHRSHAPSSQKFHPWCHSGGAWPQIGRIFSSNYRLSSHD